MIKTLTNLFNVSVYLNFSKLIKFYIEIGRIILMSQPNYFLNIENSILGNSWRGPTSQHDRISETISQIIDTPIQVCQILARLGITPNSVENFLSPKLRDLLPDPFHLKDMDKASKRLVKALENMERVAIFADYDVDGAASATLIITWLRDQGLETTLYVPDRIKEGYGPNTKAFQHLSENHDLIICVDCGTLSFEPIQRINNKTDVIIIDHHLGGEELPAAVAVVNPNRQDEASDMSYICAAGVVFLFLVATASVLREKGVQSPNLINSLDLVALATIADVVPLVGINRAFVKQGLKILRLRKRPGLKALMDVSKINIPVNEYHLGFILGPRINAGGRVGMSDLGARLLSTTSDSEAEALAEKLEQLNQNRKNIESRVQDEALSQIEKIGVDKSIIVASGDDWHPGVIGIVASRIKEKTNRPAFVVAFSGDIGKGSGRSIPGIDLGSLIQKLVLEGLIEKGGGHAMAAGITLSKKQLTPAFDRLAELINSRDITFQTTTDYYLDGLLMPNAATIELIDALDTAGPFGSGSPHPKFVFPNQNILFTKRVGTDHLKLTFGSNNKNKIEAICFRAFNSSLGEVLENHSGKKFHLAGVIGKNTWQGRQTVQLIIEDAAYV